MLGPIFCCNEFFSLGMLRSQNREQGEFASVSLRIGRVCQCFSTPCVPFLCPCHPTPLAFFCFPFILAVSIPCVSLLIPHPSVPGFSIPSASWLLPLPTFPQLGPPSGHPQEGSCWRLPLQGLESSALHFKPGQSLQGPWRQDNILLSLGMVREILWPWPIGRSHHPTPGCNTPHFHWSRSDWHSHWLLPGLVLSCP